MKRCKRNLANPRRLTEPRDDALNAAEHFRVGCGLRASTDVDVCWCFAGPNVWNTSSTCLTGPAPSSSIATQLWVEDSDGVIRNELLVPDLSWGKQKE